jgi:3D (Asp-Asp-Asp) domain-containing protein
MRIISILVTLPVVWVMLFPHTALAAEIANTNTQINFDIQENSLLGLHPAPYSFEGYEPVKSEEETARENKLARFKDKLEKAILPKGKFIVNASAYTAAADECGKSDGITASGVKVKENRTLACPSNFPFGAKIKIAGMGTYVCEDRGGAIKNNHIDIYMKTKKEAFAFGRKNLEAEVIQ